MKLISFNCLHSFTILFLINLAHQMSKSSKRTKKNNPTYFISIISISLILFVLGIIATFFVQSAKLSQSIKENLTIQLVLKENVSESDRLQLSKQLENRDFAKSVEIVNKEDAAELMKEELGEDFINTIGYNPLPDAVLLKLNAPYSNKDSVAWIMDDIRKNNLVSSINYDAQLLEEINNISTKVLIGLLAFLVLLILVSYIIIDNTIKLAMFSKRFIIRSMQLVGATRWFITKPFILRGLLNGIISTVLASLLLMLTVFLFEKYVIPINVFANILDFILIFGALIILGVLISLISTSFAVRKYLRMKLDDLY